jgi:elongator complex protein 3
MEQIILNILEALRRGETVDDKALVKLIHAEARREGADKRDLAKRRLLPFYQRVKREEPARWAAWNVDSDLERQLLQVLRMKPRRTASGVATITVITKPWPCSGDCLFCPNDLRMPKSYLHAEPACARAEQNCFDPYLQVSARLTALSQMGHATDKIELIVLGGTWSDYPQGYQAWFMSELFRALNDDAVAGVAANPMLARPGISRAEAGRLLDDAPADALPPVVTERRERYRAADIATDEAKLAAGVADEQGRVDAAVGGYNRAVRCLYGPGTPWGEVAEWQAATMEELEQQQRINETAKHRVVGLVIETRPDAVTPQALTLIRRLGCTKIQMGIQSLDQHLLDINERRISVAQIERAFSLARLFGFKIHAHFMLNLLGATPEGDKRDYERFMTEGAFIPVCAHRGFAPGGLLRAWRVAPLYRGRAARRTGR